VDILDPVAHQHYHWTIGDKVALRSVLKEVVSAPPPKVAHALDADAPVIESVPTRHSGQQGRLRIKALGPSRAGMRQACISR